MIGLSFFPVKSADVRGEGTRDARLRMSAGEAKRSRKSGKLHKLTARAIDCKTVGFFLKIGLAYLSVRVA